MKLCVNEIVDILIQSEYLIRSLLLLLISVDCLDYISAQTQVQNTCISMCIPSYTNTGQVVGYVYTLLRRNVDPVVEPEVTVQQLSDNSLQVHMT